MMQNITMGLPDSNNTFNKVERRTGSKDDPKLGAKRKSQMSEDAYVNQNQNQSD